MGLFFFGVFLGSIIPACAILLAAHMPVWATPRRLKYGCDSRVGSMRGAWELGGVGLCMSTGAWNSSRPSKREKKNTLPQVNREVKAPGQGPRASPITWTLSP